MEKTLFNLITEAVEKSKSFESFRPVTKTEYRNKTDENDVITEEGIVEAFLSGKSINDYEKITTTVDPVPELYRMIFGDVHPKRIDFSVITEFHKLIPRISSGFYMGSQSEQVIVKSLSEHQTELNRIKVLIKKETDPAKIEELKLESVYLFINSGKEPKKSYTYYDLWLSESQKVAATKEQSEGNIEESEDNE